MENFEKWVNAAKFKTMKPNTMNKYGAVLDDFGLEAMLNKLMEEFICPLSKGDDNVLSLCILFNFTNGNKLLLKHVKDF